MNSKGKSIAVKGLLALVILCAAGYIMWPSKESAPDPEENRGLKQETNRTNTPKEARRTPPARGESGLNNRQGSTRQDVSPAAARVKEPRQNTFSTAQNTFQTAAKEPLPARTADGQPAGATGLNLKLRGVVIGSGNSSSAAIMDGETLEENIYHVNDTIGNARITAILPGKVILEVNDRQEALLPSSNPGGTEVGGETRRDPASQPRRPALVETFPPPDPSKSVLGADVASRLPAMTRQKRRPPVAE